LRYLNRIAKAIFVLCVVTVLTACKLDFSIPIHSTIELSVQQSNQEVLRGSFHGDDPVILMINDWIVAHSDGWRYAFITRPSNIYVAGEKFSVNIQEHEVSVKYCRGLFNCQFFVKNNEDLYPLIRNTATLRALPVEK
jgi:hypothetical protein